MGYFEKSSEMCVILGSVFKNWIIWIKKFQYGVERLMVIIEDSMNNCIFLVFTLWLESVMFDFMILSMHQWPSITYISN